ncbi:ArsR/SmtB family transcription factor [Sneathiella aquimaris]|uniref:ArsR/SmtB family transcription factor n=1 Tax=Sneathiella aquimaris TaxID=2599305 RepID=UPI00146C747D|nr:helix-turn-helix domain-containing protein [Sneathiella aquimaris]
MDTVHIAQTLAELGHQTRLEIFRTLVKAGPAGLSIGDIGSKLGVPASTLGFHIKGLVSVGLISQEKQGRAVICRPELAALTTVIRNLEAECCSEMAVLETEKEEA